MNLLLLGMPRILHNITMEKDKLFGQREAIVTWVGEVKQLEKGEKRRETWLL